MSRVLLYDIEITPTLAWTYGNYEVNVVKVEREPYIMSFAYKWLGDKMTYVVAQPDFAEFYKRNPYDDSKVVAELWRLMDEADIVVAHNATKFDNRVANERFLMNGLTPPSPYRTIDTLTAARRFFKSGSNALDYLCRKLELGSKPAAKHGALWRDCVEGDMSAWKKMKAYNKSDIDLLEALYLRIRPYITNHPILKSGHTCSKCGSENLHSRGFAKTNTASYRRYQCQDCGGWSRYRLQNKDVDKPCLTNA